MLGLAEIAQPKYKNVRKVRMLYSRDCHSEKSQPSNLRHVIRRLLRKAWNMLSSFVMKAMDVSGSGRINL
jgi:hypothetical protein